MSEYKKGNGLFFTYKDGLFLLTKDLQYFTLHYITYKIHYTYLQNISIQITLYKNKKNKFSTTLVPCKESGVRLGKQKMCVCCHQQQTCFSIEIWWIAHPETFVVVVERIALLVLGVVVGRKAPAMAVKYTIQDCVPI